MEFMLGCNYWASNAGAEMWVNWDETAIEEDLSILSRYGIKYLRVFPNWKDFQPVEPLYCGNGNFYEYAVGKKAVCGNSYYLNDLMLARFNRFCELAEKYELRLLVGLITGWMSGRLFIPPALYGKNIFTDPAALMFQQKLIRGFVTEMKDNDVIYAWDLGNECNCMSEAGSREAAYSWSAMAANAIRACDPSRPVFSGMHSLGAEGIWTIQDQAETTDILTTHPYPYWVRHCSAERIASIRTLLHATAETKYYGSVGEKECLVEELGTMGPMICGDQAAAGFLRVNLYSNWANGAAGVMWWCACEQSDLNTPPYTWNMCERELGMLDGRRGPKPVLQEIKSFADFIGSLDFTPPAAETDAVCILTRGQDHWGIAYMTYILAKQAGMNIYFCYCEQELPDSEIYLLPSISGHLVMNKRNYDILKEKVRSGAELYISSDGGFLTEFESLAGVAVTDSEDSDQSGVFELDGYKIDYQYTRKLYLEETTAKRIAGVDNRSIFIRNQYGHGTVYYLNMPLEKNMLYKKNAFDSNQYRVYQHFFREQIMKKPVIINNKYIGITYHNMEKGDSIYVVMINYSDTAQSVNMELSEGCHVENVYIGDVNVIPAYEACVFRIIKDSL